MGNRTVWRGTEHGGKEQLCLGAPSVSISRLLEASERFAGPSLLSLLLVKLAEGLVGLHLLPLEGLLRPLQAHLVGLSDLLGEVVTHSLGLMLLRVA